MTHSTAESIGPRSTLTIKPIKPETFQRMAKHYSERAICEIVWLVASEHFYNVTNIGLNIHSDMLCDIARRKTVLQTT